jgi:hypothetical protein
VKGTDCTRAQLDAAGAFLERVGWKVRAGRRVTTRAEVLRLLVWYAELRGTTPIGPAVLVRRARPRLPQAAIDA